MSNVRKSDYYLHIMTFINSFFFFLFATTNFIEQEGFDWIVCLILVTIKNGLPFDIRK